MQDETHVEPVETFELNSHKFVADPYTPLAQLRAERPLHRFVGPHGRSTWFVTRFEDVLQVLKEPRFSVVPVGTEQGGVQALPVFKILLDPMIGLVDPPHHTRLRSAVSQAFTPGFVEGLRPRVQAITDELIDAVEPRGRMEFIGEFAFLLPVIVIAEMLGVPREDRDRIRESADLINRSLTGDIDADSLARMESFAAYLREKIDEKSKCPAEDLISQLVQVETEGLKLNDRELVSMIATLLFAGHETTVNLLGNGMLALFSHPGELAKLKRDPQLIPSAVEEMLRYCGPVISIVPRYAMEDVELGGQSIRRGDAVLMWLAAANRDPAQFTNPDTFDVARAANKHLALGHGIHFCLGAPLARLEAQVALANLLRRLPGLRLDIAPEAVVWRGHHSLRGPSQLPMVF